jgi:glycosyltransferase involved in cell wall biosynthesis
LDSPSKLLSIITINFNNRVGLEKTINSVKNQTNRSFEYIIIDGGSTDGSIKIIEDNLNVINYWVSEKDKGVYNAMNKGIRAATGDYLLFLNSGDYFYDSSALTKVLNYPLQEDIIYGDLYLEGSEVLTLKNYPSKVTFNYFFSYLESLPHPSSLIKKSLFSRVGLYNEEFLIISDWEFWLKAIFLHQATYKKIPVPISVFNINGISSAQTNILKTKLEKEVVYHKYFNGIIEDYQKFEDFKKSLNSNRFIRILKKLNLIKIDN